MNKEKFINKLNEELEELKGKELLYFNMRDSVQEARCTNRIFGIQYALNCARLLDEPQKVTVPACAGELLDYYRKSADVDLLALLICFKDWYFRNDKTSESEEAIDWLVKHPEKFMKAWIDGYEVEESKWVVNEGDLVIRKGEHEAKVYFVESVDDDGILLVNGIKDEFFTDLDERSVGEESINYFYENFRLLAKKENLEVEKV